MAVKLNHLRLYTKADMLSALTCAGQFAHVDIKGLAFALDRFYSPMHRDDKIRMGYSGSDANEAVPDGLWEAWQSGYLTEKVYSPLETVRALTESFRQLCPVCLNTEGQRTSLWHYRGDSCDEVALMPNFLMVPIPRNSRGRRWIGPVCDSCYNTMSKHIGHRHFDNWTDDEINFGIAKMMLSSTAFKKRVKTGPPLRFNPRRIQ